MIEGLEQSLGTAVPALAVPEQYDLDEIERWVARYRKTHSTLVALGRRALTVSSQLDTRLPILMGGINDLPGQNPAPGISLIIDSALQRDVLDKADRLFPAW